MRRAGDVLYRLFFTRDDDLDVLQLLFVLLVLYAMVAFGLAGAGVWKVSTAAWAFLGGAFGTLAIAGTPRWVAELLRRSKMPGELAAGIAQSGTDFDYDERDDDDRAGSH
jgi:hypothetical protein